jgi:hypothetical protein
VSRPHRPYALPESWQGSANIHVAEHDQLGLIVGGPTGLFRLGDDGLSSVHDGEQITEVEEGAVYGLHVTEDWIWVASETGLHVYDGRLRASPISGSLEPGAVRALASFEGDLWMATATGIWTFDGSILRRLLDIPEVFRFSVGAKGALIVVQTLSGESRVLKRSDAVLVQQSLSQQGLRRSVVADDSGRLFSLEGDRLLAQLSEDKGLVWRGVALSPDEEVGAQMMAQGLAAAQGGDGIWIAAGGVLSLWRSDSVLSSALPDDLGTIMALRIVADDALWVIGRQSMLRVGGEVLPAPSWCLDIEPMYQANCERCHSADPSSQAVDLSEFSDWRDRFAAIYALIGAGAMPKDTQGELSAGSLYLLQRWQEGEMIECE